jgi:hypothetical protein
MPMALRHGALPETLAVAQGAVLMPLETLVVYIADCKLRSPPITFKYAGAAAVMLLAATVPVARPGGRAGERAGAYRVGFIVAPVLGIAVLRERATERRSDYCRRFLPGRCWRRAEPDLGDDIRG